MEPTIVSTPLVPPAEETPKKKTWIWIVVIVAVVLVLCCCCVIFGLPAILAAMGSSVENVFDQINSSMTAP